MSRYDYIIYCEGCPILWKSILQTGFLPYLTESEYKGLSYALQYVIPIFDISQ